MVRPEAVGNVSPETERNHGASNAPPSARRAGPATQFLEKSYGHPPIGSMDSRPTPNPLDGQALTHQVKVPSPVSSSSDSSMGGNNLDQHQVLASPRPSGSPTGKISTDEFRSIIDDLTIENRALKERLAQFESSVAQTPALANDRLFEVKVHGLRSHRKQELIETLKAFASRDEIRQETQAIQTVRSASKPLGFSSRSTQPRYAVSASQSTPQDSAYASNSVSAPSSDQKTPIERIRQTEDNAPKIEPPEGTPSGLLPKAAPFRTDREKKVLVVRRLEHLFSGESAKHVRSYNRVSLHDSANSALWTKSQVEIAGKGARESNMLEDSDEAQQDISNDNSTGEESSTPSQAGRTLQREDTEESNQRVTRPLDVDPDRVQVPKDNISYIKHLGISPNIAHEEVLHDANDDGWVYLNLLINLAQLHILNVTPDFVRSAITEVSKKFELSPDRQKVRWRGGGQITKFLSDSDGDGNKRDTTDSSDGCERIDNKRRRIGGSTVDLRGSQHKLLRGLSSTTSESWSGGLGRKKSVNLDYKPLFAKHRRSPTGLGAGDDLEFSYFPRSTNVDDEGVNGPLTMMSEMDEGSNSAATQRAEAGPIIFFSGASFYIDYSGDSTEVLAQMHSNRGRGRYDYTRHPQSVTPLGSESTKSRSKTTRCNSSTRLRFRPFKDYAKVGENRYQDTRSKTPEVLASETDSDFGFTLHRSIDGSVSDSTQPPMPMEASGLGGIRPLDRFIITVETSYTKIDPRLKKRMHDELAKTRKLDDRIAELIGRIEEIKLDPSRPMKNKPFRRRPQEQLFRARVLSERLYTLMPSEIPPAAQFVGDMSDSEDGTSSVDSTDSELNKLKEARPELEPLTCENTGDSDWDNDDGDDDSVIDMLAGERKLNPERVAEEERMFERQLRMGASAPQSGETSSGKGTAGENKMEEESSGEESDSEDNDEDMDDSSDEDDD